MHSRLRCFDKRRLKALMYRQPSAPSPTPKKAHLAPQDYGYDIEDYDDEDEEEEDDD